MRKKDYSMMATSGSLKQVRYQALALLLIFQEKEVGRIADDDSAALFRWMQLIRMRKKPASTGIRKEIALLISIEN